MILFSDSHGSAFGVVLNKNCELLSVMVLVLGSILK